MVQRQQLRKPVSVTIAPLPRAITKVSLMEALTATFKRPRSPIEAMIDQACGIRYDVTTPPKKRYIFVDCPSCHHRVYNPAKDTDPPNATRVECLCLKCLVPGDYEEVFFDAAGRAILNRSKA